jgi:hypothetical protein
MQALSFSRRALIPSFPATAGKGDHAAQQRGGRGVGPEAMRAVNVFLKVERGTPSTALRAVPLPRFAGADEFLRPRDAA